MMEEKAINGHDLDENHAPEQENTPENKLNRAIRREMAVHNEYLKELLDDYIKCKNKNFGEDKGFIIIGPEAKSRYSFLNFKWNQYCEKAKLSRKFKYNPGPRAFVGEAKKHNAAHSKLCWVNYIMMILKAKHKIEPNAESIFQIYREDYLPEDAIVDIFCSHQINLDNA